MAKKQTNPAPEKGNPPVAKLRNGLLNATIWAHVTEKGTFYNVTFERRYRDAKGDWKSTQSFDRASLLKLANSPIRPKPKSPASWRWRPPNRRSPRRAALRRPSFKFAQADAASSAL